MRTIDDDDDDDVDDVDSKLSVIFMDSLDPFSRRWFVLPNNGDTVIVVGTVVIIGGHQYNFHNCNISENHKITLWNQFPIVFVNNHSIGVGIDMVVLLLSKFNEVDRRLTVGIIGGLRVLLLYSTTCC